MSHGSLLCVNYHYVEMPSFPYPGIHSISSTTLLNHVQFLRSRFRLVSIEQLAEAVSGNQPLQEPKCLITFDDGLRCHFDTVFQLSQKHDFPVAFFVTGKPFVERKALLVHKNQYVRARTSQQEIAQKLERFIAEGNLDIDFREPELREAARNQYRYDATDVAVLKYVLNYRFSEPQNESFISALFADLEPDEGNFCDRFYLSEMEVKSMHRTNHCIGSHAYSHRPLAKLDDSACRREISDSRDLLTTLVGSNVCALSYPLGNEHAVTRREADYAASAGYTFAVTMERSLNLSISDPLLLARLDCNDLPILNDKSDFQWSGMNLSRSDGSIPGRKRYIQELPPEHGPK